MDLKFRTLEAEEIDCRVSQIASNWLTLLLYKDARVDQNILDETVGAMNWQKKYLRDNANCIVEIWDEDKKQWVAKEDTGTESFSEAEKGLASDSFKRACFNWGIGRELYTSPSIFIFPKKEMGKKTRQLDENGEPIYEPEFFQKDNGKYDTKTRFKVDLIKYDSKKNITDLVIKDNKGNTRFAQVTKETEKELLSNMKKLMDLIKDKEEKDKKFKKENLFKYFGVDNETQLGYKDTLKAIAMLNAK
jgi:hypothetical protein